VCGRVCVASRADTDAELTLSKRTTRNERKVSIYTVSHKSRQKTHGSNFVKRLPNLRVFSPTDSLGNLQ